MPLTPLPKPHTGGVSFGGMTTAPWTVERLAEQRAMMDRRVAEAKARDAGKAETRFRDAAILIADATGDERLWACWGRGLDNPAEVRRAREIVAQMQGPAADQVRAALDEMDRARAA